MASLIELLASLILILVQYNFGENETTSMNGDENDLST